MITLDQMYLMLIVKLTDRHPFQPVIGALINHNLLILNVRRKIYSAPIQVVEFLKYIPIY